jgi:hypothetical protein
MWPMTGPLDAMRERLDRDVEAMRDEWPEGTMWRAWGEAGASLRKLGIELLAASPVPWLYRKLTRRP